MADVIKLQAGKMSLDRGPNEGDHLWVAKDLLYQPGGYEKLPEWSEVSSTAVTSGHLPKGVFNWRGGAAGRIYIATNDKFWEYTDSAVTDVTGSTTPDNATYGCTFAGYGEWVFAANGFNKIQALRVPQATGGTDNFEAMLYTTGGAKIAPKYICSHKNHLIGAGIRFKESWGVISTSTSSVGGAFTNQPVNGRVEFISTSASDTQSATVYGTRSGQGNTLFVETLTLNGLAVAQTVITNWSKILATAVNSVAVGTITLRNVVGATTITAFAPAESAKGVFNVPADDQDAGNQFVELAGDAATTKRIGIVGTNSVGTTIYDSVTLTGTTPVQSNVRFATVANLLIGDLESARVVTYASYIYPSEFIDDYLVWWSGTDDPEGFGTETIAPQITGSGNQPLLDGWGKITGVVDGGDCFFVFKTGSIYRFDGPPFQPTVISYTHGMKAGNLAYKQGERIYFWSDCGLMYIDINTNQVVNVMRNYLQRAVVDYANANNQSLVGGFPLSRVSNVQYANAVNTDSVVTINGDPANSLVAVLWNNVSSPGSNGAIYHETEDVFTLLTGPLTTLNANCFLTGFYDGSASITPGVFQNLRLVRFDDATHFAVDKAVMMGFGDSVTRDAYMRWPFFTGDPNGALTRVTRVRPVFDAPHVNLAGTFLVRVEVVSISGTKTNWKSGVASLGFATTSKDGWITVDRCPYADRHSIGVSILASGASNSCYVSGWAYTEVEVQAYGSKRSI